MSLLYVLLQAAPAGQGGGMMSTILMMVLIIVVFYFFMIRPQTKKQKEIENKRNALKKGDKVVTAGGIHGIIKEINDDTMLITIADGVRIKVDKTSVYALDSAAPAKKSEEDTPKGGKDDKEQQDESKE